MHNGSYDSIFSKDYVPFTTHLISIFLPLESILNYLSMFLGNQIHPYYCPRNELGQPEIICFPTFPCRVLQKLQEDEATVVIILPVWPTHVWFLKALHLLAGLSVRIPHNPQVLPQNPALIHPRSQMLISPAMTVSGNVSQNKAFCQRLPNFYLIPESKHATLVWATYSKLVLTFS